MERCRLCENITDNVLGQYGWYFCIRGNQCYYKFHSMVEKILAEEAALNLKKLAKLYIKGKNHL